MDPLTLSVSFATVVGLVSDFMSQRSQVSAQDYEEFVAWLTEHRHDEVVRLLEQQSTTSISIKALLSQDRTLLLDKLEALDRTLASFASAIGDLKPVVNAVYPDSMLSEHTLDILRQFHRTDASRVLPKRFMEGMVAIFMDGAGGQLKFSDPRFVEDDLRSMVDLGLLRLDRNQKWGPSLRLHAPRRGDCPNDGQATGIETAARHWTFPRVEDGLAGRAPLGGAGSVFRIGAVP